MNIDWIHFTPWLSLAGGVLLGLASAAFILVNGRILGISGILGGLLMPRSGDMGWRIAFLLGMAASPLNEGVTHTDLAKPTLRSVGALWLRRGAKSGRKFTAWPAPIPV